MNDFDDFDAGDYWDEPRVSSAGPRGVNGMQLTLAQQDEHGRVRLDADIADRPAFTPAGKRKTSSGTQLLLKPNDAMREIHARARCLLEVSEKWLGGSRRGLGYQRNAMMVAEAQATYLYVVDLQDAFGSVDPDRLAATLQRLFAVDTTYPYCFGVDQAETRDLLDRYFLNPGGGLIQGGPASSSLFELYVERVLERGGWDAPDLLADWCYREGISYGRYVDDLVFANKQPITHRQRLRIKQFIREAGFTINEQKVRGVVLRKQTVTLNGVSLRKTRSGVRVFMPRKQLTRLEGMLHLANTGREVNEAAIHGLMGVFFSCLNQGMWQSSMTHILRWDHQTGEPEYRFPHSLNATERRVLRAYRRWHPLTKPRQAKRDEWRWSQSWTNDPVF